MRKLPGFLLLFSALIPAFAGTASAFDDGRHLSADQPAWGGRIMTAPRPADLRPSVTYGDGSGEAAREKLLRMERSGGRETAASPEKSSLRERALGEAASTLAFQQGLAWRYAKLMDACGKREHIFDRVFNFGPLLMDGRVLPPVIRWAGRGVSLGGNGEARSVEASYRIVRPAAIVTRAPTWRDYLMTGVPETENRPAILPATQAEKKAWKRGVTEGWAAGAAAADELFSVNMNRLVADYRGILRFRMLARRGMVSLPVLAEGRLAVRVEKRTLDVGETTFRISVPAEFRDMENWSAGTDGREE